MGGITAAGPDIKAADVVSGSRVLMRWGGLADVIVGWVSDRTHMPGRQLPRLLPLQQTTHHHSPGQHSPTAGPQQGSPVPYDNAPVP